jgi:hypothetical protein
MATTLGQIGVLLTESGTPADAVAYNLQSLLIHLELKVPQAGINLWWLNKQRSALGEEEFHRLLSDRLDQEDVEAVLDLLRSQVEDQRGQ